MNFSYFFKYKERERDRVRKRERESLVSNKELVFSCWCKYVSIHLTEPFRVIRTQHQRQSADDAELQHPEFLHPFHL